MIIGKYSYIRDSKIDELNVSIGDHFYAPGGLRVGGGGHNGPDSALRVGDRCTFQKCFINTARTVIIGNDVGLSDDVAILTHGFWKNVLNGYPAKFAGVTIGNGVIVGYGSIILPGVEIADNTVIGAGSVVAKSITFSGVYAGNPAKFIKKVRQPSLEEVITKADEIVEGYKESAMYYGFAPDVQYCFPEIQVDGFKVNVLTLEYSGEETETTDHFRDYLRRWGIRIYTERPFG